MLTYRKTVYNHVCVFFSYAAIRWTLQFENPVGCSPKGQFRQFVQNSQKGTSSGQNLLIDTKCVGNRVSVWNGVQKSQAILLIPDDTR